MCLEMDGLDLRVWRSVVLVFRRLGREVEMTDNDEAEEDEGSAKP